MALTRLRNNALDPNTDITADQLDIGQIGGRRNLIINGGFDVWQRGTSWSSASNAEYTVDRWQTYASSMTCNIDRSTDVPANQGFKYSVKIARSISGLPFLRQRIEDFDTLISGREFTLSFWAKADNSCELSVDLGDVGDTVISLTTTWQKYTVNFASTLIPTYDGVDFQGNSSTTPMYFTGVQLELGSVATPFEHRSYGEELALCQRYYRTVAARSIQMHYVSPWNEYYGIIQLETPMRAAPSVSFGFNNVTNYQPGGGSGTSVGAIVDANTSIRIFSEGANNGYNDVFMFLTNTGNTSINIDAEL